MLVNNLQDTLTFRKFKGKTVQWLIENQRGYLRWAIREDAIAFTDKVGKVVDMLLEKPVYLADT